MQNLTQNKSIKNPKITEGERALAELLHAKLCSLNHTDYCGWYDESWENLYPHSAKQTYLGKARKILAVASSEEAMRVFRALEK